MDAEDAVEAAAFAALNVPAVTARADVFQHVPQNYEAPEGKGVLILGDMDSQRVETKGGRDQQVSLVVAGVIDAKERKAVRRLKAVVLDALADLVVDHEGWRLQFIFDGADGFLDPETGKSYAGNFRFTVWAFAQS
jgi:hypothetical protein